MVSSAILVDTIIWSTIYCILIVSLQEQKNKLRSNLGRLADGQVSKSLCNVPCH